MQKATEVALESRVQAKPRTRGQCDVQYCSHKSVRKYIEGIAPVLGAERNQPVIAAHLVDPSVGDLQGQLSWEHLGPLFP